MVSILLYLHKYDINYATGNRYGDRRPICSKDTYMTQDISTRLDSTTIGGQMRASRDGMQSH